MSRRYLNENDHPYRVVVDFVRRSGVDLGERAFLLELDRACPIEGAQSDHFGFGCLEHRLQILDALLKHLDLTQQHGRTGVSRETE